MNDKIKVMTPEEFNETAYNSAVMSVPCGIWENERLMFGVAHQYKYWYGDELGFQPIFYYATPALLQREIDGVMNLVSERGNRKVGIVPLMNSELYTEKSFQHLLRALKSYLKRGGEKKFDEICVCMPDQEDEILE